MMPEPKNSDILYSQLLDQMLEQSKESGKILATCETLQENFKAVAQVIKVFPVLIERVETLVLTVNDLEKQVSTINKHIDIDNELTVKKRLENVEKITKTARWIVIKWPHIAISLATIFTLLTASSVDLAQIIVKKEIPKAINSLKN